MTIIAIRIYAYIYLNYPLTALPIPGIIILLLAYKFSEKYDQVKFYSEKDNLTGLYNRRVIDNKFPCILAKVSENNGKLAILIFDCDKFKIINDTYGHVNGDLVLREIAAILLKAERKSDIVSRWGGDEFLVIVPNTNENEIKLFASKIDSKLQELSKKLQIEISISSGFSIYPKSATNLDGLIIAADDMMYDKKSKSTGNSKCFA